MNRPKWTYSDPERYGYAPIVEKVCKQCNGKGKYVRGLHPDWGPFPCPDCNGKGYLR